MAFITAAAIIGGTTLAGAYLSSNASKNAANAYTDAANQGISFNREMYGKTLAQNQPYMDAGAKGLGLYNNLADSGYLTAQPSMNDLTSLMPNYKFGMEQGLGQFNAGVNAGGGLISGNAIQGGQQFAQDYAGNALNNAFNQYQANRTNVVSNVNALTGVGQNANAISAGAASGTSANVGNLMSSIGNAQASGIMGGANAYTSGLNNLSNYAMLYGMNKMNAAPTSDIRTKENIQVIGWLPNGLPVYIYEYKDEFKNDPLAGPGQFIGVMAHELEKINPNAVSLRSDGYKMVDYSKV
jgi:hypothetical protein